jgi:2-amino-4-hydroxy-6-hydroxymethyldihydropteridine diphosphokinase
VSTIKTTTAYLSLGSNRGDRAANLRYVAQRLEELGVHITAKSKLYESESVESGGMGDFLNAALRIETPLSAHELLDLTRRLEEELGRPPARPGEHRPGPRLIDIDILLYGDEEFTEPVLQIPHPRMHRRLFVLKPLLDVLDGGWVREANEDW